MGVSTICQHLASHVHGYTGGLNNAGSYPAISAPHLLYDYGKLGGFEQATYCPLWFLSWHVELSFKDHNLGSGETPIRF